MALQSFSVLRAQDPTNANAKLVEITPKNWRRYPTGVVVPVNANVNEAKPRYNSMTDWAGGARGGEDPGLPTAAPGSLTFNTATVSIANDSGGANEADYTPRTQYAKSTAANLTPTISGGVVDQGRPRGPYLPSTAYLTGGSTLAAPTVTSVSPNTAAAGSNPILVTITGTNFFPQSRVITGGGNGSPWDANAKWISATQIQITIDPRSAVAGTASVAVLDHSVLSNTDKVFTFT